MCSKTTKFQAFSEYLHDIFKRATRYILWASQVAQWLRIRLPMQEVSIQSLDQGDPLKKEMATHSSILAWRIPWTEEPGRL